MELEVSRRIRRRMFGRKTEEKYACFLFSYEELLPLYVVTPHLAPLFVSNHHLRETPSQPLLC